jgi:hypothetical protein
MLNSLSSWLPQRDGQGLICWRTNNTGNAYLGIVNAYVYDDDRCNSAVGTDITPGTKQVGGVAAQPATSDVHPLAAPDQTGGPVAAGDNDHVLNLLGMISVLCPWYAYPGDSGRCDSYGLNQANTW